MSLQTMEINSTQIVFDKNKTKEYRTNYNNPYVNKCGFHVVKFINEKNTEPDMPEDFIGDVGEGMFVFEKIM